jgi:DNA polymerase-1
MVLKNTGRDIFLAIDANAIVHRAFHAYPPNLQTEDGLQVNAVYGFTVMLLEALEMFHPEYVLCAFDTPKPTFRHAKFTDYKATRKPADQSLVDQFPLVEEVLKGFNIPILKVEGFEADDILGTMSKYVTDGKWKDYNLDMYILSGDRDLLQLINKNVWICLPDGNFKNLRVYDRMETFKKYGYYPEQVIDYKAIVGDASDNIPGVKGVGDKTVIELLQKYKTLDKIYESLNELKPRTAALLGEGIEQAEFSRDLATIDKNVSVSIQLNDCLLRDFDRDELTATFKKFAFKSLFSRLDSLFGKENIPSQTSQLGMFENTSLSNMDFSKKEDFDKALKTAKKIYYAYFRKEESQNNEAFSVARVWWNEGKRADFLLKPETFSVPKECEVIFYNWEDFASQIGLEDYSQYGHLMDIGLLGHLIKSNSSGFIFKDLAFSYATKIFKEKISSGSIEEILDSIGEIFEKESSEAKDIQQYDFVVENVKKYFGNKENEQINTARQLEVPVSVCLGKMERRGVLLDKAELESLDKHTDEEIRYLRKEIFDCIGHEVNINSPKQLADLLFEELQLPHKGKISTRESVLQGLLGTHPVIEHILKYREISKISSTYIKPLLEIAESSKDGAVHTDFKQTGTTSGRFSSSDPNLQNIPIKGDWAERIRNVFIAREGFKLLALDYAQIELRIMAHISKDELLIKDFKENLDIHTSTAARIMNKSIKEVTKQERAVGKTVNFAILFGQTQFGLSSMLGISRETAQKYIDEYFENYKNVAVYVKEAEKEAKRKGFVQSMFGTTRHIAGLTSKNFALRNAAMREAINMPIQGSEADIMKLAMIKIMDMIDKDYKEKAYILLQIHDELVLEVEDSVAEEISEKCADIMDNVVDLLVPLDVHANIGHSLAELK